MKHNNNILNALAQLLTVPQNNIVITLRVFIDEYLDYIKNSKSMDYYKSVRNSLARFSEAVGLQTPIGGITQHEIELYFIKRKEKAPKGYHVCYRNLKAAFNKAMEWEYIYDNPFIRVKLEKKQRNKPITVSKAELERIIFHIENADVRDAVLISFYSGCRLGEVINLVWANIDLGSNLMTVGDDGFKTKSREQRFIPLCGELVKLFIRRSESRAADKYGAKIISIDRKDKPIKGGYVVCKMDGRNYHKDYVSKKFKDGCRAAGIDERVHFHTLRHSFASHLAEKGVPIYTIQKLLGHSSVNTTMIYAHLNIEAMREAVKVL